MAIFGRIAARQRLRRATRESLTIPAFSSPIDCTPWVTGGLWPAELSTITAETATLAEYLKADLQRIAHGANDQLKALKRSGMTEPARQSAEARVIDEARERAVHRVESTVRYLHSVKTGAQVPPSRPQRLESPAAGLEKTQVLPVISEVGPVAEAPSTSVPAAPPVPGRRPRRRTATGLEETQVIPVVTRFEPAVEAPADSASDPVAESTDSGRHHAVVDEPPVRGDEPETSRLQAAEADLEETQVVPLVTWPEPAVEAPAESAPEPVAESTDSGRHHALMNEPPADSDEPTGDSDEPTGDSDEPPAPVPADAPAAPPASARTEKPSTATGFDTDRLNRLLEFVVRQEPRLNWAIGDQADGTTVLVTDLAHGWIPSGITLPAGVRLLEPERRTGRVAALIGDTERVVTYVPGASLRRSADFAATRSSVEARQLPAIADLPRVLSEATRGRDDLPRIVQRLADAAAAGTVVVDQEVDVLRVHLDTARYQLMVQYPSVNPALLLKCLLMAATEGIASGDTVSANYHLAWYRKLSTMN